MTEPRKDERQFPRPILRTPNTEHLPPNTSGRSVANAPGAESAAGVPSPSADASPSPAAEPSVDVLLLHHWNGVLMQEGQVNEAIGAYRASKPGSIGRERAAGALLEVVGELDNRAMRLRRAASRCMAHAATDLRGGKQ